MQLQRIHTNTTGIQQIKFAIPCSLDSLLKGDLNEMIFVEYKCQFLAAARQQAYENVCIFDFIVNTKIYVGTNLFILMNLYKSKKISYKVYIALCHLSLKKVSTILYCKIFATSLLQGPFKPSC